MRAGWFAVKPSVRTKQGFSIIQFDHGWEFDCSQVCTLKANLPGVLSSLAGTGKEQLWQRVGCTQTRLLVTSQLPSCCSTLGISLTPLRLGFLICKMEIQYLTPSVVRNAMSFWIIVCTQWMTAVFTFIVIITISSRLIHKLKNCGWINSD